MPNDVTTASAPANPIGGTVTGGTPGYAGPVPVPTLEPTAPGGGPGRPGTPGIPIDVPPTILTPGGGPSTPGGSTGGTGGGYGGGGGAGGSAGAGGGSSVVQITIGQGQEATQGIAGADTPMILALVAGAALMLLLARRR